MVAPIFNPSYLVGRNQENLLWGQPQQKVNKTLFLNKDKHGGWLL
jgi:hypothetical protein